jgi:glycosyltransferase involved in cell wall biosynthesis
MKIRAFTNDSGSAWWRLESVAKQVNMRTDHEFLVFNHKQWTGDALDGDIVIFQMLLNPEVLSEAKAQGAMVVYEIDDLLIEKSSRKEIDSSHRLASGMIDCIKMADMVTTTTKPLAEKIKKYNDNVVVLPNYIDTDWWGPASDVKTRGEIRVGWAGSISHDADLEFIAPVMERIIKENDNVRFVYCGAGGFSSNHDHTELMYRKDFFKNIPSNRREFFLGTPHDIWGYKSKTLYFDIAIAPLIDDEFNKCKSNIKWQEYSLNKWAGVYSDAPAYSDIKHGVKAKTQEDFYQQITRLIANEDERKELAQKAYDEVYSNWTIDRHFTKWLKAYKQCLNQ